MSFTDPQVREGVGWLRLNVRERLRQSSSVAYLHPLARLANLSVLTETTALRLLLADGPRAAGVETTRGTVRASREVIVSCGAFDSPKLLLLSGIGAPDDLAALGIPVRAALPGVGRHLIDHPEGTLIWQASRPVPTGVAQDWEVALFARVDSSGADAEPQLMIHFGTMPVPAEFLPAGAHTPEHVFWMTPNVIRPRSEGSLRLRSADPADPPLLDPRYYTDPEQRDERVMLAGVKLARRLAEQPTLRRWIERELLPGPDVRGDTALSEYARLRGTTVHHPAGTCRMGARDDPLAVVDPELRVRGVAGLRVADASVFPTMIGVNICLTCMLIGERCADFVRAAGHGR